MKSSRHIVGWSKEEVKTLVMWLAHKHLPALGDGCKYLLCVLIGSFHCQHLVIGRRSDIIFFSATPRPRSYAVDIYIAVQSLSHLNKHRNCIKRLLSGSLSSITQYNDLTLPEKAFRFRSLCPVPWSFSFEFLPLANENEQIWSLFLPKLEILR